jgi:hypothetical protein
MPHQRDRRALMRHLKAIDQGREPDQGRGQPVVQQGAGGRDTWFEDFDEGDGLGVTRLPRVGSQAGGSAGAGRRRTAAGHRPSARKAPRIRALLPSDRCRRHRA